MFLQYLYALGGIYYATRVYLHHRKWPRTVLAYVYWPVLLLPRFRYLYFRPTTTE